MSLHYTYLCQTNLQLRVITVFDSVRSGYVLPVPAMLCIVALMVHLFERGSWTQTGVFTVSNVGSLEFANSAAGAASLPDS